MYLELELVYNPIRAAFRLLFPTEKQYNQHKHLKANLMLLRRNYDRMMQMGEVRHGSHQLPHNH